MRAKIFLFITCLTLMACGPSKREELLTRLASVKEVVYGIENASSGSTETESLLEYCQTRIALVDGMIQGGDLKNAETALAEMEQRLDRFEPPEGTKEGPVHIIGSVTFVPRGAQNYGRMTASVDMDTIERIRTGIRSGLSIEIVPQSRLWLPAQSEVKVGSRDSKGRYIELELIKGTVRVDKSSSGRMVLQVRNLALETAERVDLEVSNQPLTDTAYVSLFTGEAKWKVNDREEKLDSRNGLLLVQSQWIGHSLPSTPIPGEPSEGDVLFTQGKQQTPVRFSWSTVAASPEYQIQISENQYFASRVHDQLVTSTYQEVTLPPGDYYWRVRGYKEQYLPGGFSRTRSIRVRVGTTRPATTVSEANQSAGPPLDNLEIEVISDMVIVNGRTSSSARITVNDTSAFVVDKRFRAVVNFNSSGKHRVVIKAIDPDTGAETVEEREVTIRIR